MGDDASFKYVDDFNSTLKKLTKFTVSQSLKLKVFDWFAKIERRINLAINESPLMPMELIGPRLVKYGDQIKKRNVEFFLNADFADDMDDVKDTDRAATVDMIKAIKDIYANCTAEDRDYIADLVDDLLINYCGYGMSQRMKAVSLSDE